MGFGELRAVTRAFSGPVDVLSYADPVRPQTWLRGDRGFAAVGQVLRIEASGTDRFANLDREWQKIASKAVIDDPVQIPGSGLIALGTTAFADHSGATSVLTVPRTVVHQHDDHWFLTEISFGGSRDAQLQRLADAHSPQAVRELLPEITPDGVWQGTDLDGNADTEASARYRVAVREAANRTNRGVLDKVVIARPVSATLTGENDLRVPLRRLAERYLNCWTFAIDGIIGATPETLIRLSNGQVSGLVLAGTAARSSNPEDDTAARDYVATHPHITEEHRYASESVIDAIRPLVTDLHTSSDPLVIALPNVWHRATRIAATPAPDNSSLALAAALHPTAAVAGTPTPAAVQAIAELEGQDRRRYAGAVGWIDANGDGEWAIALRSAELSRTGDHTVEVTAWVGGGIVAGADVDTEFEETVSKLQPMREAFRP